MHSRWYKWEHGPDTTSSLSLLFDPVRAWQDLWVDGNLSNVILLTTRVRRHVPSFSKHMEHAIATSWSVLPDLSSCDSKSSLLPIGGRFCFWSVVVDGGHASYSAYCVRYVIASHKEDGKCGTMGWTYLSSAWWEQYRQHALALFTSVVWIWFFFRTDCARYSCSISYATDDPHEQDETGKCKVYCRHRQGITPTTFVRACICTILQITIGAIRYRITSACAREAFIVSPFGIEETRNSTIHFYPHRWACGVATVAILNYLDASADSKSVPAFLARRQGWWRRAGTCSGCLRRTTVRISNSCGVCMW